MLLFAHNLEPQEAMKERIRGGFTRYMSRIGIESHNKSPLAQAIPATRPATPTE